MSFKCLLFAALIPLASSASAQGRVEVSGSVGYTGSEGVNVSTPIYNRVDPAGSSSYNFTIGGYVTEQAEIEFLFSHQSSTAEVSGSGPKLTGDMSILNYHGNFVYNFGHEGTVTRPFAFVGFGATTYGDATFPGATVPGLTRFSWGLGGGVKAYPSPHVGVKAMVRWVPTYIKSDASGWWCDPFWGCGVGGNAKYSNQFEISGGLVARF